MPTSTNYLRNKFMKDGDDGIGKAEEIIKKYGGEITLDFYIKIPKDKEFEYIPESCKDEIWDAVQFLCEEWDYAIL